MLHFYCPIGIGVCTNGIPIHFLLVLLLLLLLLAFQIQQIEPLKTQAVAETTTPTIQADASKV